VSGQTRRVERSSVVVHQILHGTLRSLQRTQRCGLWTIGTGRGTLTSGSEE
jgi:hypothetical protein